VVPFVPLGTALFSPFMIVLPNLYDFIRACVAILIACAQGSCHFVAVASSFLFSLLSFFYLLLLITILLSHLQLLHISARWRSAGQVDEVVLSGTMV